MKKFLVMLAIAACAVSAQAAATAGIGLQLKQGPGGDLKKEELSYVSIYSMRADTLKGISSLETLSTTAVADWINKSFLSNSDKFSKNANSWQIYTTSLQPRLTDNKGSGYLVARTAVGNTVLADNEWILMLYDNKDGNIQFRVTHAISGGDDDKVTASGNVLNLAEKSFVVRGGDVASKSEWGGWTAANVPEPTSGLLFLLGVAGLALKRKRA